MVAKRVVTLLLFARLAVYTAALESPGSEAPPKPVISFDFCTDVSLTGFPNVYQFSWCQLYDEGWELLESNQITQLNYTNALVNYKTALSLLYNTTDNQCDLMCNYGQCCGSMNKERPSFLSLSELVFGPPPPPPPSNCSCGITPAVPFFWGLYENATYAGPCSVGSTWETKIQFLNDKINWTLCYDDSLQAPSTIQIENTGDEPLLLTFSNWNGTPPASSLFAVPSYCQCNSDKRNKK
eukprot:TRINITY_DN16503_c0_g1_i1.p1 TRINITY_DN16503_c0_g1~~TRINITY_DN16503_c0_g1_i1.p1  ORF type:complete len:239 (-),score=50.82 TRINITY_DN16503_c0_g1_i1:68-784(-)